MISLTSRSFNHPKPLRDHKSISSESHRGGWRFTVDCRGLNKVISNESWRIPNMRDMLMRIGHLRPKRFAVADLTSRFSQIPLHEDCRRCTAFWSFRGIYEWTRVPMGLLSSANYFQQACVFTFLVIYCIKYAKFISTTCLLRTLTTTTLLPTFVPFSRCHEENVTLNSKKLMIGKDKIPFVGHEIDSSRIKMSQKRIEGAIAFTTPRTLKELQSFLGFKDHALIDRPL